MAISNNSSSALLIVAIMKKFGTKTVYVFKNILYICFTSLIIDLKSIEIRHSKKF